MTEAKLTLYEQEKAAILTAAITGKITNHQAAKQLQLSVRQVQRVKARFRTEGVGGVVHKLKGRLSNHRYSEEDKEKVLRTIKEYYADFKPGFATEKLRETTHVLMTSQTIRAWMTEAGLWKIRTQKQPIYRSWRQRKEYFGELEQFDGSYHYWFENRYGDEEGNPIEVCLLAAIDDATGKITGAMFAPHEGVVPVFMFWKAYVQDVGRPLAIYLDSFSTYKINHKHAVDNKELMTRFEQAMRQLNIQLMSAHSPQAKGRIERLFGTLQDRLVKELRLANINTPDEGNRFLQEEFIPKFNNTFTVIPARPGNVHRPLATIDTKNLNRIFSIQSTRTVNNDFTIQFKNNWYQLAEVQPVTVRAKEKVLVEEWLDGTVHFCTREKYLVYILLPGKPKMVKKPPLILTTHPLNWKPLPNHPWRQHPNHFS